MKKLENHLIGVDQGEAILFSDFEHDGPMWSGEGTRDVIHPVRFSSRFRAIPAVSCSLSMLDMSNKAFTRFDLKTRNVTEEGFDIVFSTWADSKIARVRIAWQAIGELPHDDDWDIE